MIASEWPKPQLQALALRTWRLSRSTLTGSQGKMVNKKIRKSPPGAIQGKIFGLIRILKEWVQSPGGGGGAAGAGGAPGLSPVSRRLASSRGAGHGCSGGNGGGADGTI